MYSRFTALEDFGKEELERLGDSTAAVIGLGATGSVIAENLARHGVSLIVIDRDYLEENDLYSSNLYTRSDVEKGLPKAEAAGNRLEQFTDIETHVESLGPDNSPLLEDADILLDGTDNLETRFLLNDYAKKEDKPWIYTAAIAGEGYSMLFDQGCFNCVFDKVPAGNLETCETAGIMREAASIAASRSSWKAVQYLTGKDVEEKLEIVPSGKRFDVEKDGCEVCEQENFPHLQSTAKTVAVCGENKYQIERDIGPRAFDVLEEKGELKARNDHLIRVEVKGREFTLFRSGRAIIEASDSGHAEEIFAELLG
ncbi:MAG: ThiF family adenylyltransferase [Candidatus Nanohaloarchaea archaeon]